MKVTYSLRKMQGCFMALGALAQATVSAVLGYNIGKAQKVFQAELKTLNEAEEKLVAKYGGTIDKAAGGKIDFKNDNEAAFLVERDDLLDLEVEIELPKLELGPKVEIPSAALVLNTLADFVSVIGVDTPEPRKPNPKGDDGKPMSDGETAQRAVDGTLPGPSGVVK